MRLVVVTAMAAVAATHLPLHAQPVCSTAPECQAQALEAEARQAFEDFHTLAWRVMQTSRRQNDPAAMALLARAQSLSGRAGDSLVMLRRLAEMGIAVADVETSDAFARVRSLAGWPEVLEKIRAAANVAPAGATAKPALKPPVTAPTVPSPEAARAERKSPPEIDKEIGGGRVPAAPPPPPPPALAAKPEARVAVSDSLAIPSTLTTPIALDYDSVSKRFVFADDGSETLKVVDELSGNAVDLVSRGWAKAFRTTALVIDARRGDLWVASTQGDTSPRGAVHRLQLVSGRLLYTVEMPEAAAPSRFVDVALDGTNVLVLDSTGRRIYEVASGSRKLQLRTPVEIDRDLTSLAPAGDGIVYVAHADGLLRVQLGARRTDAIKAGAKIDLRGLEWIRHQQGRLLGIQRRDDGTRVVVSIRLDRRRRTAIALDVVDVTHAPRAAVSGTHLYFVGATATGPTMKRVELR